MSSLFRILPVQLNCVRSADAIENFDNGVIGLNR